MKSLYLMLALFISISGQLLVSSSAAQSKAKSSVLGYWYMGTATGQDCNLIIKSDSTLSVQDGGCFYQAPLVIGSWAQKDDKVILEGSAITKRLGSYLRIIHSRGYTVLVPQVQENAILHAIGYPCVYCFWQNKMGSRGLELPGQAWDDNRVTFATELQAYKQKNHGK